MRRREFLAAGVGGALGMPMAGCASANTPSSTAAPSSVREQFPRLENEAYLNAASGTPLARFVEKGLDRYRELWRDGSSAELESIPALTDQVRGSFARLVGVDAAEIGLVHCTKAGEQTVLEGLPSLRRGAKLVTNDLHFSGSLHNFLGRRSSGLNVEIVRGDQRSVPLEAMEEAIDDSTALVAVTLVSNVNGHVEPMAELARIAHRHGALVYADIIQAAGIVPLDLRTLDVDFAACSAYKWLFGPHGVGFFYVRSELQGTGLEDRLFPGHARHNYPPWVDEVADGEPFLRKPPIDAQRYQPGHLSYLGYSATLEGLNFLHEFGVGRAHQHSVELNRRLVSALESSDLECLTPDPEASAIVSYRVRYPQPLRERLEAAKVVVSLGGGRLRVSPAVYNDESDVDRLIEALHR